MKALAKLYRRFCNDPRADALNAMVEAPNSPSSCLSGSGNGQRLVRFSRMYDLRTRGRGRDDSIQGPKNGSNRPKRTAHD